MIKKPNAAKTTNPGQPPPKADPAQKLDQTQPEPKGAASGNQQLRRAQDEAKEWRTKYDQLQTKYDELNSSQVATIAQQNQDLERANYEKHQLEGELASQKGKESVLLQQLADIKNKNAIQSGEAASKVSFEVKEKEAEIRHLNDEIAEKNKGMAELRGQFDDLINELNLKNDEIEDLRRENEELMEQNNTYGLKIMQKEQQQQQPDLPPLNFGEDDEPEVVQNVDNPPAPIETFMQTAQQTKHPIQIGGLTQQQQKTLLSAINEAKHTIDQQKEQIQTLAGDKQGLEIELQEYKQRTLNLEVELHRAAEESELKLQNLQANFEELQNDLNDQTSRKTMIQASDEYQVQQKARQESLPEQNILSEASVQPIHVFHSLVTPSAKELERVNYAQMRQKIVYQELEIQQLRQQLEKVQHLQDDNQLLRNKMSNMLSVDTTNLTFMRTSKEAVYEKNSQKLAELNRTKPEVGSFLKSIKEGKTVTQLIAEKLKSQALSRNTTLKLHDSIVEGMNVVSSRNTPDVGEEEKISQKNDQTVKQATDIQQQGQLLDQIVDQTVINILGDDDANDLNALKEALASYQQACEAMEQQLQDQAEENALELQIKSDQIQLMTDNLEKEKKKEKNTKTIEKKKVLRDLMIQTDDIKQEVVERGIQSTQQVKDIIIRQTPQLISDDGLTYNMTTDGYFCLQDKTGYNKYSIAGNVIIDIATNMKVRMNGIYKDLSDMYQVKNGVIDFTSGKPNSSYKLTPLEDRTSYPAFETQLLVYKKELQRVELENDDLRFQLQKNREQISKVNLSHDFLNLNDEQGLPQKQNFKFDNRYVQTDDYIGKDQQTSIQNQSFDSNQAQSKIQQLLQNSKLNLDPVQQQQLNDPILQLMQQQLSQNNVLINHLLYNQTPVNGNTRIQQNSQIFSPSNLNSQHNKINYQNQECVMTSPTIPLVHQISLDQELSKFVQTDLQVVSLDDYMIQNEKYKTVTKDRTQLILDKQKMNDLQKLLHQKQNEVNTAMKVIRDLNQTINEKDSLLVVQADQIGSLRAQLGDAQNSKRTDFDPNRIFELTNQATKDHIVSLKQRIIEKENTILKLQQLLAQTRDDQEKRITFLGQQLQEARNIQDVMKGMELDRFKRDLQIEEICGNGAILDAINGKQLADHQLLIINQTTKISEQEAIINKCRKALDVIKKAYNDQQNKSLYLEKAATACKYSLKMVADVSCWPDISTIIDSNQFDTISSIIAQKLNYNGAMQITPIIQPSILQTPGDVQKSTLVPQKVKQAENPAYEQEMEAVEPDQPTKSDGLRKKVKKIIK